MRHITLVIAVIALTLSAPALSEKGGNGGENGNGNANDEGSTGPLEATISLNGATALVSTPSGPMVSGDVTFTVTRSKPTDEVFWITNKCWDGASALVTRTDTATLWGTTESLVGSAGPMPTGGVSCMAYVTLRPWQDRPLKDAVVEYNVV
ncbi:MAG: hypothetical protein WD380_03840 [Gaiellaceae bacterium]